MTQEMGRQITSLRLKGLGYKSIAIVVGTSRENVRYYCKTHDLEGTADEITKQKPELKINPETCKFCGKKIIRNPRSGKKLFCSDDCRRAWWRKHPEEAKRGENAVYECECAYCKRTFISYGNSKRKYCCHDCYIQDRFWTDHDVIADAEEIALRQKVSQIIPARRMELKRIS